MVGSLGLYPGPGMRGAGCGVLPHTAATMRDWEGLVPVGAGQGVAAGGSWTEDTHHHRVAFCVHLDSGRSVPARGEWSVLRVPMSRMWGLRGGPGGWLTFLFPALGDGEGG